MCTHASLRRYYLSRHCAVCDEQTHASRPLCDRCLAAPQLAAAVLASRWNRLERQYAQLVRMCAHCGGGGGRSAAEGERGMVRGGGAAAVRRGEGKWRVRPGSKCGWQCTTVRLSGSTHTHARPAPVREHTTRCNVAHVQVALCATRSTVACTLSDARCGQSCAQQRRWQRPARQRSVAWASSLRAAERAPCRAGRPCESSLRGACMLMLHFHSSSSFYCCCCCCCCCCCRLLAVALPFPAAQFALVCVGVESCYTSVACWKYTACKPWARAKAALHEAG